MLPQGGTHNSCPVGWCRRNCRCTTAHTPTDPRTPPTAFLATTAMFPSSIVRETGGGVGWRLRLWLAVWAFVWAMLGDIALAKPAPFWTSSGAVAPELWPAFEALAELGPSAALSVYELNPVVVRLAQLPSGRDGRTIIESDAPTQILVNSSWSGADPKALATVLVHEATHLQDFLNGQLEMDPDGCMAGEIRAFSEQARAWQAFYGPGGKSGPSSRLDRALNALLDDWLNDQATFTRSVRKMYAAACAA